MATAPSPLSRKPQDNVFTQQRLRAFSPIPTPNSLTWTLLFFGVFFLVIGGVIQGQNATVVTARLRYDNICPNNCTLQIQIAEDMPAPVYFYYQLTEFSQNYRRYVKSRADTQLRGKSIYSDLSSCDPLETYNGNPLYPCGLVAFSMFNDTFTTPTLTTPNETISLTANGMWSEKDIAWPSDKEAKFKTPSQPIVSSSLYGPNGRLPNVTDEHFIVWMRTAGMPNFHKLYAKISRDLKANETLQVFVTNQFFIPGEKWIVLSTVSRFGLKNEFIAVVYFVVGGVCLFLALAFFLKHKFISSRALGEVKYYLFPVPFQRRPQPTEVKQEQKSGTEIALVPAQRGGTSDKDDVV